MARIDIIKTAYNRYLVGKTIDSGIFFEWADAMTLSGAWAEAVRHSKESGFPIDPVSDLVKQELIDNGFLEEV